MGGFLLRCINKVIVFPVYGMLWLAREFNKRRNVNKAKKTITQ